MKIKASEAEGQALDWAVAKAAGFQTARMVRGHGYTPDTNLAKAKHYTRDDVQQGQLSTGFARSAFNPSTNWEQGGPIIERECLSITHERPNGWRAETDADHYDQSEVGPTPLVAAMRCYVASKLGDEVDIPKELK
jgi:hypothetical protein